MSDPRIAPLSPQLSFPDGPEADWKVLGFTAREALDTSFTLTLVVATDDAQLETRALLGAACELALQRGVHSPSSLFGVVGRVDYLGYADHRLHLRLEVVPAVALAQQRRNSRIWQATSVQNIVTEVLAASLDAHGRTLDLHKLQRGATARDYCVQYAESDYDFVRRLLEEEGIAWHFVHDPELGHEVLTLCDDNSQYPAFENLDGTPILPLITHNPDQASVESAREATWSEALTSTSAGRSDFDPAHPGAVLASDWGQTDRRGRDRRVYAHGGARLHDHDPSIHARNLAESLHTAGSVLQLGGNTSMARPGMRITLEGFNHDHAPREWLITEVDHSYQPGQESSASDHSEARAAPPRYRSDLRCIPLALPWRPLTSTPKPVIPGPQTATVVGGGEIDVDSQGRIQVQMHWEERPGFAAGASCRVRCAQSWAGGGWGAQFIPRVGMEVVVEFLEGNPDRPLVTGCVYNGANSPPFPLPGEATQSGWRSESSPGGGGSNELRFDDATGSEEIYIHAQRDWNTEVGNDKTQLINNDETLRVGHKRHKSIEHDESITVGGDESIAVGGAHSETIGDAMTLRIGASQRVSVGANQDLSVGGSRTENIGASATQSVLSAKTVTVGGALATVVGAAMNTSVAGLCAEEVGGLKMIAVGASSSESVVGGKTVSAASIAHSASGDLGSTAGGNLSLQSGADFSVSADGQLTVHGQKTGTIELGDQLTIKVGKASITLKKTGEIVLDGVKVVIKAKRSIDLKAKKVNHC